MGLSTHPDKSALLRQELELLDMQPVLLDGLLVKPSQCYHFSADPLHVLYNTNCPEELMNKIDSLLAKYSSDNNGESVA